MAAFQATVSILFFKQSLDPVGKLDKFTEIPQKEKHMFLDDVSILSIIIKIII